MKQIEESNKAKKELLFNKQHVIVWFKEFKRLKSQYKFVESELDNYSKLLPLNSVVYYDLSSVNEENEFTNINEDDSEYTKFVQSVNLIDELEKYTGKLSRERYEIKTSNDLLLAHLREDLKYYMRQNKISSDKEHNKQVIDMVDSVKRQFNELLKDLDSDYKVMSQELAEFTKRINQNELQVKENIPSGAYDLDCPNEELKASVLQEFIIIDYKYKEKLSQLNEMYRDLVEENNANKYDGWSQDDHDLFQHIYEQYHYHSGNLNNCNFSLRDLMFDKMRRVFLYVKNKKYERHKFVKHEEWSNANKYFHQQKKLIITEWTESRRGLLLKAEAVFAEAFEMIEAEKCKKEEKERQLRICNELYEKVSKWRNQKLEALEIQQTIDKMIKQQNAERLRVENERKNQKRMQEKQAVYN